MAAATPITLPGSQSGFIAGNLGVYEALEDFSSQIDHAYGVLVQRALDTMTVSVQTAARAQLQWQPYADHIVAAYTDGEFIYVVNGTDEDAQAISDLEYGVPGIPPSPVLRSTLLRDVPTVSKMLEIEIV